jgi:hypothetical protein
MPAHVFALLNPRDVPAHFYLCVATCVCAFERGYVMPQRPLTHVSTSYVCPVPHASETPPSTSIHVSPRGCAEFHTHGTFVSMPLVVRMYTCLQSPHTNVTCPYTFPRMPLQMCLPNAHPCDMPTHTSMCVSADVCVQISRPKCHANTHFFSLYAHVSAKRVSDP